MNYYSSVDMLGFIAIINHQKIPRVAGKYALRKNGRLTPHEVQLLKHARRIHHRYEKGELTHTDSDETAMVACANMLMQMHCDNERQQSRMTYNANKAAWRVSEPLPRDAYTQVRMQL